MNPEYPFNSHFNNGRQNSSADRDLPQTERISAKMIRFTNKSSAIPQFENLEPRLLLSGAAPQDVLLSELATSNQPAIIVPITIPANQVASGSTAGSTAPAFTIAQTLSDQAQLTTLAFDALGMMTGNLNAQSFFPPGKLADYFGFQYLRDNDPDGMGHNTSFLTRVANNLIYSLNDTQFGKLVALASAQIDQVSLYAEKRFTLMAAFRQLMDGNMPSGSTGLNLNAVKEASADLYTLDGRISLDRAATYASILNSMSSSQKAYLDAMKGHGFNSWPDISNSQIEARMRSLPQGTAELAMTYASDIFSWYAGSATADVYFCPERQGTYFGSFYIKDAPAVGHEGYTINEQLTATAGSALCDRSKGYVTQVQASMIASLVDLQRNNLYAGSTNIVQTRTQISTLLRSFLAPNASVDAIKARVLLLSATYGVLDGENNYNNANVFAQVYKTLTSAQKTKLMDLRKSIMSGTYADGTPFDFSVCSTSFLYSSQITDQKIIASFIANARNLFFEPSLMSAVADQSMSHAQDKLIITLNGSNGYGGTITYTAALAKGTTAPSQVAISVVGDKLSIDPAANYSGQFTVNVTATDGIVSTVRSFKVSVTNAVPVLAAIPDQVISHKQDNLVLTLNCSDADKDAIKYSAVLAKGSTTPAQVAIRIVGDKLIIDPAANYAGQFVVNVTASDGISSSTRSFKVTVANMAPVLATIPDQITARAQDVLILPLDAFDKDNDVIRFMAALTRGNANPSQVSISVVGNKLVIKPQANYRGQFSINLTASDGITSIGKTIKVNVR